MLTVPVGPDSDNGKKAGELRDLSKDALAAVAKTFPRAAVGTQRTHVDCVIFLQFPDVATLKYQGWHLNHDQKEKV